MLKTSKTLYERYISGYTSQEIQASVEVHDAITRSQEYRLAQAMKAVLPTALLALLFYFTFASQTGPIFTVWIVLLTSAFLVRFGISWYIRDYASNNTVQELLRNEHLFFVTGIVPQVITGAGYWYIVPIENHHFVYTYAVLTCGYALGSALSLFMCRYLSLFLALNLGSGILFLLYVEEFLVCAAVFMVAFVINVFTKHFAEYFTESVRIRHLNRTINEDLVRAIKEKQLFIAAVSHDLSQPLLAINMHSSSMKYVEDPMKLKTKAEEIESAARLLSDQVKSLNDHTYSELQQDVELVSVDVVQMAGLIVRSEKKANKNRNVDITLNADGPVYCIADKVLLYRALSNLVNNAVKYTPEGYVSVEVSDRIPNDQVVVRVSDTGIGIRDEHHDSVFKELFQVSNESQGVGLGLYTVRRNCELMGASLRMESDEGIGTMFEILLPKTRLPSASEAERERVSSGDIAGVRLLVVDDNKTARDSLVSVFTDLGCLVTQASSAEEAMFFDATEFDFAVIDYMLSEEAQYTGCDLISDLGIPATRVCIVTGTNHPEVLREISDKYALYRKPLDSQQFGDLVSRIEQIRLSV